MLRVYHQINPIDFNVIVTDQNSSLLAHLLACQAANRLAAWQHKL